MSEITTNSSNMGVNSASHTADAGLNEIVFVGHMVSRIETQGCLTVRFRSTTVHGRSYTNSLTLLAFDPELHKKINSFGLREKVRIKGYLSSSRRRTDDNGEQETSTAAQEVVPQASQGTGESHDTAGAQGHRRPSGASRFPADDLEDFEQILVISDIEDAGQGEKDENTVSISGTVVRARVTRKGSVVFVVSAMRPDRSGFRCLVKATASPQTNPEMLSLMASGTRVRFKGHCVGHSLRSDDGRNEYIQNLVIDEIGHA